MAESENGNRNISLEKLPPVILLLGDEQLRQLVKLHLRDSFDIFLAENEDEVKELAGAEEFALLLSDRWIEGGRLPTVLIGLIDVESLVAGINSGFLLRAFPLPIDAENLADGIRQAWSGRQGRDAVPRDTFCQAGLFSALSHDIRNLAAGITGIMELIAAGQLTPQADDYQEMLLMGYQCGRDLLDGIGFIVDLRRMLEGTRTPHLDQCAICDLASFALDRVKELSKEKNITISLELEPEYIIGDRRLLQMAMVAMLCHAVRVSPGDSTIALSAGLRVAESGSESFVVQVTDGGPSFIPSGNQEVLDPITLCSDISRWGRTRITLDDVELSYCCQVARLHHGYLVMQSQAPRGNTLTFVVPLPAPDIRESASP